MRCGHVIQAHDQATTQNPRGGSPTTQSVRLVADSKSKKKTRRSCDGLLNDLKDRRGSAEHPITRVPVASDRPHPEADPENLHRSPHLDRQPDRCPFQDADQLRIRFPPTMVEKTTETGRRLNRFRGNQTKGQMPDQSQTTGHPCYRRQRLPIRRIRYRAAPD